LRRQGIKVKLQEQPFQVLEQLLEKPGEVVTREELRNRLWPADTFVDFDHSLNAAIRRLRDALGDSAENPRFVETVARRGYRFVAPVDSGLGNGAARAEPAAVDSEQRSVFRLHLWWVAAGACAVLLVLVGIKFGLILAQQHPTGRVSQLTANPADDRVRAAAISRDGRYLAFSDENGFYVRQIDTGETHSIAPPQGQAASSLAWFPDSVHMVVAFTGTGHETSLWEASALGGNARKFIDDGHSPAVSPDGATVAFIAGKKLREQIWLVAADGTQPRKLVGEEGDLFGSVTWSPDGSRIAYTRAHFEYGYGAKGAIEILDLKKNHQAVTSAASITSAVPLDGLGGPLFWARDGRLIFSLYEARPRQLDSNLWWVALDRQTKPILPPTRLTNDVGAVNSISVSGDGKRVAYLKGVPEPDVYIGKLQGSAIVGEPQRLTLDDRQDMPFDWTSDNKAVIFMSDRTGTFNIYKQSPDQAVPEVLVGGNNPVAQPRLSPDGTQLLYVVYPNWGENTASVPLMRVPVGGGTPQPILKEHWISNHQCARAPASVCIYSVAREGALTFFTFDPFHGKGSQVYQIKDDLPQLYNWSLSPDGTTLAIAKGKWEDEEPKIHLVPVHGGTERWLHLTGKPGLASLDWAADSKALWASSISEENALLHIDLQGHAVPVWRPKNVSVGWAIPSRDGRSVAILVSSGSANVWMLERP
jgi:Tol biopolymer transport system component/DNA-binding winged helix-turn-helix (wHTH) protein